MHVLLAILSVAAGAAFWVYRLRMLGGAAKGAYGAAQSARGHVVRRRRAARSDFAPITAIDAPPVAAATWMRLQMDLIEWEDHRAEVAAFLAGEAGEQAADEAVVYADWAAGQGVDAGRAVRVLRERLEGWLDPGELATLDEAFAGLGDARGARLPSQPS